MKIEQYNFIRGLSNSGKSLFCHKLIGCLNNKSIYYDIDGGSVHHFKNYKPKNTWFISTQNKSFSNLLRDIKILNENNFEMYNIIIDSITSISSNVDEFVEFTHLLPKNNRYFFISNLNKTWVDDTIYLSKRSEVIEGYNSYVQSDSISVFDVSKKENNILIYNYNTNETYNLGDVPQIIRDMKINEVLND